MLKPSTLSIYQASAGAGKTHTLVKEYIALALASEDVYTFKNILAVTFTNKAAYEIKARILESLRELSETERAVDHPFFEDFLRELNCDGEQLTKKAKWVLEAILHRFSDFFVHTLDKFTHKIVRTFATDFNLASNFDLETQGPFLLKEAVEHFLSKISLKGPFTPFLTEFCLENLKKGIHWDPSEALLETAGLLLQQESIVPLQKLRKYNISDFYRLKNHLQCQIKSFEEKLSLKAKTALEFIKDKGIAPSSFSYSDWPNALEKIIKSKFLTKLFSKRLHKGMLSGKLYSKTSKDHAQKKLLDDCAQEILNQYTDISDFHEKASSKYLTACILLKNISRLAMICEIDKELSVLKKEKNVVLIQEMNQYLARWTKGESVPYIYERLGERYVHYFIDEFQDTSLIQWKNFKPLIENALAQGGTAMIVGDIKQSIYRWRGAHPELLLSLSQENNVPYNKKRYCLKKNFRSLKNIVRFNNEFYCIVAELLSNPYYKEVYQKSIQEFGEKNGGYIELHFLSSVDSNTYDTLTYERVRECIEHLLLQGYHYEDICLLVRKKKQVAFLAESLISDQKPVISSESLLLKNASAVKIILGYLEVLSKPEDLNLRIDWSLLLLQYGLLIPQSKDAHCFLNSLTKLSFKNFFKQLIQLGLAFRGYLGQGYSLYELCEEVIKVCHLEDLNERVMLDFFLDVVYRAMQKGFFTPAEFLKWWDQRQDKEFVSFPNQINAIKIMTVHQAKGLEFPVVLLPFANWSAWEEKKGGLWLEVEPSEYEGFDLLYANTSVLMKSLKKPLRQVYDEYLSKVQFDHLNLLYVATTRAIEQLFVFSRRSKSQDGTIAFYLEYYLKTKSYWNPSKEIYKMGSREKN